MVGTTEREVSVGRSLVPRVKANFILIFSRIKHPSLYTWIPFSLSLPYIGLRIDSSITSL